MSGQLEKPINVIRLIFIFKLSISANNVSFWILICLKENKVFPNIIFTFPYFNLKIRNIKYLKEHNKRYVKIKKTKISKIISWIYYKKPFKTKFSDKVNLFLKSIFERLLKNQFEIFIVNLEKALNKNGEKWNFDVFNALKINTYHQMISVKKFVYEID